VGTLLYVRLIGFTAGTLLMLFWMVVILGYRRRRNFERVLFFLCLSLFLFYCGSLLGLNAQIYYEVPPARLLEAAAAILLTGLSAIPPLLVHLNFEYAEARNLFRFRRIKYAVLGIAYAPAPYFAWRIFLLLSSGSRVGLMSPGRELGLAYGLWLASSLAVGCFWQLRFGMAAPDRPQEWFHKQLFRFFVFMIAGVLSLHVLYGRDSESSAVATTVFSLLAALPFAVMLEMVFRYNFLNIGKQRNLIFAATFLFLALLYLALVRRAGDWFAPILPPEATAAILLFLLVIFIEPLQRALSKALRRTAHKEMDLAQRLAGEIRQEARQGEVPRLRSFIEKRVQEELGLRRVSFEFKDERYVSQKLARESPVPRFEEESERSAAIPFDRRDFPIVEDGREIGNLHAEPHGAGISGDTAAALEFLCEQLPGAFDLCRLIEEKLRLERELSERERMAALGQMAASISHNLKNPLGSIKTILQVQLESPEMPESLKTETQMVLGEVSRLSNKLGQLLQFSRPTVLGEVSARFEAGEVVKEVSEVMRPEAERKEIELGVSTEIGLRVTASREAVSDIVSNLVVNGLEAAAGGGRVKVSAVRADGSALICVEDNGKGICVELHEKVMQPFFTTKTQGTGLGLAIVARRVSEAGGRLELQSPVADGRGARFSVWLPLREES
jgi:two-component sensor histidine kinase